MLLRITILAFLITLASNDTKAQLFTFQNYDHRNGLITESTLSCVQDKQGFLWVGTDGGGMMRFDGKKFIPSGPKGKSFQYHVSSIFPTDEGSIYFTTLYDGVFKYDKGEYNLIFKSPELEGDYISLTMFNSKLVVITSKSIYLLTKNGQVIRRYLPKWEQGITVSQVLEIRNGVIAFTNAGNFIIRNDKITLCSRWLNIAEDQHFQGKFASFSGNSLVIYDELASRKMSIVLTNSGEILSSKIQFCSWAPPTTREDPIEKVATRQGLIFASTKNACLFRIEGNSLIAIQQNVSKKLRDFEGLYIDRNKDLWLNNQNGLFKVSHEPFTKVELNEAFSSPNILSIHKSKDGQFMLGLTDGRLIIIPDNGFGKPVELDCKVSNFLDTDFGLFVGSYKGLLELKNNKLIPMDLPFQSGKHITMTYWDGSYLWYSPAGEGVVRYDRKNKSAKRFAELDTDFARWFYTARCSADSGTTYFGTNSGIYSYRKSSGIMRRMETFRHLGAYCGNSTTDRFGTLWFTLDKGLAGITRSGELVTIDDPNIFPSTLFYTLTADNFGNILAGTNMGINVIEVDRNGHVVRHRNYSSNEGFGGFETHMRSQYEFGNFSYVGTIEGLYLINSEALRENPRPPVPVIFFGRENTLGELVTSPDKSYYTFKCLLSKFNNTLYSYRILGYNNKWSDFSQNTELELPDLANGEYTIEVRASYDGINISEAAKYPVSISVPIWKTKWFVVILIVLLGIINLGYLEWSKSFLSSNIFNTKDVVVDKKFLPRLILFGLIVNSAMLFVADLVEPKYFDTEYVNLFVSLFLLVVYSASLVNLREVSRKNYANMFFILAYSAVAVESYWLLYTSNLHPFPLLIITMTTSVVPFIATRIQLVISICLTQLFMAALILIWIDNALYNEILFMSAITISGALAVMVTYLRNDSLEKLIFVSGVINEGNVMVISFDQQGTITYCSENIKEFFTIDFTSVVGQPSSILNPFIVSSEMRQMSLRESFEDGKIILMPMYNKTGNVIWIEWSCKYFNDSVRVIMGQDITEKMTLSTQYETLLENAQDMIFNTDIQANFLYANERCQQLFGYRKDSLIGKNALSLVAPGHRERVQQFYMDQFANRIHHTYLEFPIKSRDGRIFWVGQNVTMLHEPGSRKRIAGFLSVARNITEKRANDLLIEQQNKDITSSITYAKRIQFNLLPEKDVFHKHFEQSFVLYKPKDIVSGDFYWTEEIDGKLLVVLADCTGHGVPGAFMTLLGINLLNQIVRERKITDPATILAQLNEELTAILPRSEGTVMYDDMDALVALFDHETLSFASSGVSCIHNRNGELILHRAEGRYAKSVDELPVYENEIITFSREDTFYLFTDGYQKQFGSVRNKKFSYKRMLELLSQINTESLALQKKYFENALRNWSEGHEQTDDITVIGLGGRRRSMDEETIDGKTKDGKTKDEKTKDGK